MADRIPISMEIELTSHFLCPVCYEYVLPPIQQCPQGHLLCSNCREQLPTNHCPTCRCSLDGVIIRNLALEKIADDVLFPCKFSDSGCSVRTQWKEKSTHEENCGFQIQVCPIPGLCGFQGSYETITSHLKVSHGLVDQSEGRKECLIGADNLLKKLDSEFFGQLMSCHNHNFLVLLRKLDVGVIFYDYDYQGTVQLIGPPEKAKEFTYRMEVEFGRRKSTWQSVPLTMDSKVMDAFDSGDCFYVDHKRATLLGQNEEDININVSVFQNDMEVADFMAGIDW